MDYLDVEKLQLGVLETPLQYLENISKDLDINLYIKRDDLNGLGLGGNKVRKLKYLAKDALDKDATVLLTVGGTQTNHGRLTAAVAAKLGLKSAIVMLGNEPDRYSGNMLLDLMVGASLYYAYDETNPKEALDKKVSEVINQLEAQGERVYFIPMGGSNPLGALGYVDALGELHGQCHDKGIEVDYLVSAYGSIGTYAGLLLGNQFYDMNANVIGMNVLHDFDKVSLDDHLKYINEVNETYELHAKVDISNLWIEKDTIGDGYNVHDSKTREAVIYMAEKEAIFLDFCYTGKAFKGLLDLVDAGKIEKGATVVFLHTGGAPGIFSDGHTDALNEYYKK